ncbi:MAG: phosphonate C-P lyase system protein PhnH [Hyphomicrobiales bacterium]
MVLAAGFSDPVFEAQATFRAVAAAMAEPGQPVALSARAPAPAGLLPTTAAVLLTLVDFETAVWLDERLARQRDIADWLRFHTGCRMTDSVDGAEFAIVGDISAMPPLSVFPQGVPDYPDRSATIIVEVEAITGAAGQRLSGPGIAGEVRFAAMPLPGGFWASWARNNAAFPLGVDMIFCSPDAVAALPRSTRPILEG